MINTAIYAGKTINFASDVNLSGNTKIETNGCISQSDGVITIDITGRTEETSEIMLFNCTYIPELNIIQIGTSAYCVSTDITKNSLSLIFEVCQRVEDDNIVPIVVITTIGIFVMMLISFTIIVVVYKPLRRMIFPNRTKTTVNTSIETIEEKIQTVHNDIESVTNDVNRINNMLDSV